MENIITIKSLTKSYGNFVALNDVNLDFPKGKIISNFNRNYIYE